MSKPAPLCPLHKTSLVNHVPTPARHLYCLEYLPVLEEYEYYNCLSCPNKAWIVVDQNFYQWVNQKWVLFKPLKPRKKGILIGSQVFQPWNVHIASKNFQCNVQRCWMILTFVWACPKTGSVSTRNVLTAAAIIGHSHILLIASCFCLPPHIIITWVLGIFWSPFGCRNIKEN